MKKAMLTLSALMMALGMVPTTQAAAAQRIPARAFVSYNVGLSASHTNLFMATPAKNELTVIPNYQSDGVGQTYTYHGFGYTTFYNTMWADMDPNRPVVLSCGPYNAQGIAQCLQFEEGEGGTFQTPTEIQMQIVIEGVQLAIPRPLK